MEDFEIDIISDNTSSNARIQLPLNYLAIGEVENDDIKIYIHQNVYMEMERYALSDVAHELGTIMIGDFSEDLGKMHVVISDLIYAKYTDASASTLTFTHETWDYVHRERDEKYPDKKIVGWQHTHPGYGIFLSNYDMFIQENFFDLPFQVAYVIDPVQHLRGFFQWKNGKVEKLKGFYIYDDLGKTIKIDRPKTKNTVEINNFKKKSDNKIQYAISGALALVSLALLFSVLSLSKKHSLQSNNQEVLQNQINEQSVIIAQQSAKLSEIKEAMTERDRESGLNTTIEENETAKADNSDVDSEGEDTPETTQQGTETPKSAENRIYLKKYIVEPDDSLLSICQQNGLDYSSNYRVILSINGIEDANIIYVGQTILLPVE